MRIVRLEDKAKDSWSEFPNNKDDFTILKSIWMR